MSFIRVSEPLNRSTPLLNMFNEGFLPMSFWEANIPLMKKKKPEVCASYRPISLLDVGLKLFSKMLATSLEDLFSLLIKEDQRFY